MKAIVAIQVLVGVACAGGGIQYEERFTPSAAPPDYVPVEVDRGQLPPDCRVTHFEISAPADGAKIAYAKPVLNASGSWTLAVPRQRLRVSTGCALSDDSGARFKYSTVIEPGDREQVWCTHARFGRRSKQHRPGSRRGRGVVLTCSSDQPSARAGGKVTRDGRTEPSGERLDFPPQVEEFRQAADPLWHATRAAPFRIARICGKVEVLQTRANAIAAASIPEAAADRPEEWRKATSGLVDSVLAIAAACRVEHKPDVLSTFPNVHEAFHAIVSLLDDSHDASLF